MNEIGLKLLVEEANIHSERAAEAIESGQFEAAQVEMKILAEHYEAFCQASTDEAPEQQQDDEQDNSSADDKGCVPDKTQAHCVPPS